MNNRIDLTQFEMMMNGPWRIEWIPGADTENEEPSAAIQTEDYGTIAQTFYRDSDVPYVATTMAISAVPDLLAELKRCYEREDMIIRALKGAWIGNTCWHQPSENLEDIAETRGGILGAIASLLSVDVNRQDIHDFDGGCGGEYCDYDTSE